MITGDIVKTPGNISGREDETTQEDHDIYTLIIQKTGITLCRKRQINARKELQN